MHIVIARHDGHTARCPDHRLVRQEDFFHEFFLLSIATSAIAEVVLCTGSDTRFQVALLQTFHEGHTHGGRQIGIFAIRLLQTVETRCTADIDHG